MILIHSDLTICDLYYFKHSDMCSNVATFWRSGWICYFEVCKINYVKKNICVIIAPLKVPNNFCFNFFISGQGNNVKRSFAPSIPFELSLVSKSRNSIA